MSGRHAIQATGLRFAYRDQDVLHGVDIAAAAGRFVCLLGPNGSGKTTLLKCLLRWLCPSAGEVRLDGKAIRTYSPRQLARLLAYVPQIPNVAFRFSVREIVLMGRYAHGGALALAGAADLAIAHAAMETTETLAFADRSLDELSGGEAQAVMIARALVQQPGVLLLDEPTSHLDIRNQLRIYRLMQRLAHEENMAVVCVSHDVNLAARFADELVVMRSGRVLADGPVREVLREDVLQQAYDVRVRLLETPGQDTPTVWAD